MPRRKPLICVEDVGNGTCRGKTMKRGKVIRCDVHQAQRRELDNQLDRILKRVTAK